MEENGGKWGGKGGEMGEMGGNGEILGTAHGMWIVEGCGGRSIKMVQKREKNRAEYPFLLVPLFPFSQRSKTFPTVPRTPRTHRLTDMHRRSGWCGCLLQVQACQQPYCSTVNLTVHRNTVAPLELITRPFLAFLYRHRRLPQPQPN